MHIYKYAARYLLGVALCSAGAYVVGVCKTEYQSQAFKASELLMYTAGLLSILLLRKQLSMQEEQQSKTYQQLIRDHQWRTYASLHEHFASVPPEDTRDRAYRQAEQLGFLDNFNDRGHEINGTVKGLILATPEAWKIFRSYLDCFEELCGAINVGLVNEKYAFALQGSRVIRNYTVFKPLIDHYQLTSPSSYYELQSVALRWRVQMNVREADSVSVNRVPGELPRIEGPQA